MAVSPQSAITTETYMKTTKQNYTVLPKLMRWGSLGVAALCLSSTAHAQVTTYNVAGLADFTGPYANIMKDVTGCRRGVLDWWSEEVGKSLGVALRIKEFDIPRNYHLLCGLAIGYPSETAANEFKANRISPADIVVKPKN